MSEPAKKLVRMPQGLADVIAKRAADQGVSENTLIVALLAGGVNFKLPK